MNLPSSLALSQSSFFRSRLAILLLLVIVLAIAAGIYFMNRPSAPVLPTPATSPAAQALPRSLPKTAPPSRLVTYGPPAPVWARNDIPYGPAAPPEFLTAVKTPPAPVGALPRTGAAAQTVSPAAVTGTPAPAVPAGAVLVGEIPKSIDASVLFAREHYQYIPGDRRDPFQSLLDGRYQTSTADGSLVDVGDIHLVGIMWGTSDKFALVEDSRGRGFVLRVGDPVVNGYIAGIGKDELQVVQNAFGESQTLSIRLQTKEGEKNATGN